MKNSFFLAYHNIVRDFKQVKVLFVTILLGMILILTSFVALSSFIKYREELNDNHQSSYDIALLDINNELVKADTLADGVVDYYHVINNRGYAEIESNNVNTKKYLFVQDLTTDSMQQQGFILTKGTLPRRNSEIIIPLEYSRLYNVNVGDVVKLNLGSLTYNENKIHKLISRLNLNGKSSYTTEFVPEEEIEYTVAGIYESSSFSYVNNLGLNHYYVYSLQNYKLEPDDTVDLLLTFDDSSKVSYTDYAIKFQTTNNNGSYSMVTLNSNVIQFLPELKIITFVITTLLVLSIIFLSLTSAFQYGNIERRKYYTRIMTLGATSKEIKNSWDMQTFFVAILAILMGVCVTLISLFFGLTFVFEGVDVTTLLAQILSSDAILISILLMLIIVLLVNKVTEEKILYLAPLEAIKGNTERIKAKFVHYNNITKLKGEIDKYVKSNFELKLNKPGQVFIFTLSLSIAGLMLFISFNNVATKPIIDYLENKTSTLTLKVEGNEDYLEFLNDVSKLEEVKDSTIIRKSNIAAYTLLNKQDISSLEGFVLSEDETKYRVPIKIISIDDHKFSAYGGSTQNFVLIREIKQTEDEYIDLDKLSIGTNSNLIIKDKDNNELFNFTEHFISDNKGLKLDTGYYTMLVKDSYLDELTNTKVQYNTINLEVSSESKFVNRLNGLISEKYRGLIINITDKESDLLSSSNDIYISYITVYTLIFIASLLFIISLNSYVRNYVEVRTKELGLLKSMGASSSQIKEVISKEMSKSYTIASLLGLIIGVLANIGLTMFFQVDTIEYLNSTMNEIISIVVLVVFLLVVFSFVINRTTKYVRKSYPFDLMKDNFREF